MALLTTAAVAHGYRSSRRRRASILEPLRQPIARAGKFAQLIERLRVQANDASVDELLRALVGEIRYGDYLRAKGPTPPSGWTTSGADRQRRGNRRDDGARSA